MFSIRLHSTFDYSFIVLIAIFSTNRTGFGHKKTTYIDIKLNSSIYM